VKTHLIKWRGRSTKEESAEQERGEEIWTEKEINKGQKQKEDLQPE
jgi:hypothetical protein